MIILLMIHLVFAPDQLAVKSLKFGFNRRFLRKNSNFLQIRGSRG